MTKLGKDGRGSKRSFPNGGCKNLGRKTHRPDPNLIFLLMKKKIIYIFGEKLLIFVHVLIYSFLKYIPKKKKKIIGQ